MRQESETAINTMNPFARSLVYLLTGLLGLVVVCFAVIILHTYREYQSFKNGEQVYRERLLDARADLQARESYLHLLRNDPGFLERVVRQKLGYARPNEIIFRFDREPAGPASPKR